MSNETLLQKISSWLAQLIQRETNQHTKVTIFHGLEVPGISIFDYLTRIVKYSRIDKSEIIVGMLYFKRMRKLHRHFPCSDRSMHRTMLIMLLLATKMHRDDPASNQFFSRLGGIPPKELARLERCALDLLDYSLFVPFDEYTQVFVSVDEYTQELAYWDAL